MLADKTTQADLSIFHPDMEQSVFHHLNFTQTNAGREYLRERILGVAPSFVDAPSHAVAGTRASRARTGNGISPEVGDMVGAYKSLVANHCLDIFKRRNQYMGKIWHRNYYEHIIRGQAEFANIQAYIINNPRNWRHDDNFAQSR